MSSMPTTAVLHPYGSTMHDSGLKIHLEQIDPASARDIRKRQLQPLTFCRAAVIVHEHYCELNICKGTYSSLGRKASSASPS